jgi:hypothetical protein
MFVYCLALLLSSGTGFRITSSWLGFQGLLCERVLHMYIYISHTIMSLFLTNAASLWKEPNLNYTQEYTSCLLSEARKIYKWVYTLCAKRRVISFWSWTYITIVLQWMKWKRLYLSLTSVGLEFQTSCALSISSKIRIIKTKIFPIWFKRGSNPISEN